MARKLLSIGGEMSESKWKSILARKKPEPADARVMIGGQEMTGAQFNKMVSKVRKAGVKKYMAIKSRWDEDLSTPMTTGSSRHVPIGGGKTVKVSSVEWNDMMRRIDKFGVKRGRSVLDYDEALGKMLKPAKAKQAKGEKWEKELAETPKRKGEMSIVNTWPSGHFVVTAEEHNAMIARLKKYGKGKGYTEADYDRAWGKMTRQLEKKKDAQKKKDDAAAAARKAEGERTQMARTMRRDQQNVPPVEETTQDLITDPESRRRYREREGLGLGTAPVSALAPGRDRETFPNFYANVPPGRGQERTGFSDDPGLISPEPLSRQGVLKRDLEAETPPHPVIEPSPAISSVRRREFPGEDIPEWWTQARISGPDIPEDQRSPSLYGSTSRFVHDIRAPAQREAKRLAAQESARPFGHKAGRFLREATLGGAEVGREAMEFGRKALARIPDYGERDPRLTRPSVSGGGPGLPESFHLTLEEYREALKRQKEAFRRGYQIPSEVEEFPVLW